jgi:hypothetical protein
MFRPTPLVVTKHNADQGNLGTVPALDYNSFYLTEGDRQQCLPRDAGEPHMTHTQKLRPQSRHRETYTHDQMT